MIASPLAGLQHTLVGFGVVVATNHRPDPGDQLMHRMVLVHMLVGRAYPLA
jgi:hypothetical protein